MSRAFDTAWNVLKADITQEMIDDPRAQYLDDPQGRGRHNIHDLHEVPEESFQYDLQRRALNEALGQIGEKPEGDSGEVEHYGHTSVENPWGRLFQEGKPMPLSYQEIMSGPAHHAASQPAGHNALNPLGLSLPVNQQTEDPHRFRHEQRE